jgi:hypothetical protein
MDTGLTAEVTNDLCACGLQTPRLINLPTEELWAEDEVEEESAVSEVLNAGAQWMVVLPILES